MHSRRKLFGHIGSLIGLGLLSGSVSSQPRRSKLEILDSRIAGFHHHNGHKVYYQMQSGDPLSAVREPTNKYDANAIALYWQQVKIGYVPKVNNRALAKLIDEGKRIEVRVSEFEDEEYEPIRFVVRVG